MGMRILRLLMLSSMTGIVAVIAMLLALLASDGYVLIALFAAIILAGPIAALVHLTNDAFR
jgi:hypothetical protein